MRSARANRSSLVASASRAHSDSSVRRRPCSGGGKDGDGCDGDERAAVEVVRDEVMDTLESSMRIMSGDGLKPRKIEMAR